MAAAPPDRREAILQAGYALIAELGYERATTARICARATVSSGTFFHYFPTKAAMLAGILEADVNHRSAQAEQLTRTAAQDAAAALARFRTDLMRTARDPHLAGFVTALADAPEDPRVLELLALETATSAAMLTNIIEAGQRQGIWRQDWPAQRLATWIGVIADGVLTRSVEDAAFSSHDRENELADLLHRVLAVRGLAV